MFKCDAILLAAGLSSRMGAPNKLLLDVGGQPMIRHVARTYLAAVDGPVTIVTGFQSGLIVEAVDGLPVRLCFNPDFANGQPSSVTAGLRRTSDAKVTLIGLGDQPLLTAQDLTALIEAHQSADPAKITIPDRDGKRGNPIIVPAHLRSKLLTNKENPGCMKFTRDHPEYVQRIALQSDGYFADVDTPAAYLALPDQLKGATHAMAHH